MPTAAIPMMAAGAASAFSQVVTGIQAQRAGAMQSKALEYQAQEEKVATAAQITSMNTRANATMASARALTAAAGVSQEGSSRVVNAGSYTQARLNEAYARYHGNLASSEALYESANAKWQGTQNMYAGFLGAAGSLLTSAYSAKLAMPNQRPQVTGGP